MSNKKWSVVIFTSRESPQKLSGTLNAAVIAASALDRPCTIELLVNGNPSLAKAICLSLPSLESTNTVTIRVWSIQLGDKANAWNQYFHSIWSGEEMVFFIDGYVQLLPNSLQILGNDVLNNPIKLGGTGVPSVGRSAAITTKNLLEHGGFHGNLCCVRGSVIARICKREIRIPLGIYVTDGFVAALLCFDLDPTLNAWNKDRILVHQDVTWLVDEKHLWKWSDVKSQFKRLLRQRKGKLENEAIKYCLAIKRQLPEHIPQTTAELLSNWKKNQPSEFEQFVHSNLLNKLLYKRLLQTPLGNEEHRLPALMSALPTTLASHY